MEEGAKVIRDLRMQQGISVRKLAELANVNYVFLSKVERGLESPGEDLIKRLAEVLNYKEDVNKLIASFGKIPNEIKQIILDDPNFITEIPAFYKMIKSRRDS
ncbi:MAG: helix-turn-helix transcriptional regulator [Bacteroidales bacterium]|nr:helix-turn-helix transcriptional regulator [Bacteroidales bacterium]